MKILLADDEKPLLNFLEKGLRAEGYECIVLNQLHDVLPCLKNNEVSIVVLDRLFGAEDSILVLQDIKSLETPPMVLMLTALDDVNERVSGLRNGADDYLCKPFDFDELLARISALQRRLEPQTSQQQKVHEFGELIIYLDERIVHVKRKEINLTKIEYELLLYLVENQEKVLSRERILTRVWQTYSDPQTNIVDVYISRLRKKLDDDPKITIQTLRGNGYRLTRLDK